MDHCLLVACRVIGQQVLILVQCLTQTGDVAMAEDAQAPGEEALPPAVSLDLLHGQEPHQRLCHRELRHAIHQCHVNLRLVPLAAHEG